MTLRAAGKLQELTYEMDRYRWNILGFCEMRWKGLQVVFSKWHGTSYAYAYNDILKKKKNT